MKRFYLILYVFAFLGLILDIPFINGTKSSSKGDSKVSKPAAVPRKKATKDGNKVRRIAGQGMMSRVFREMKISFCSELEGLTLQMTRPNSAAIPISAVDDATSFLNNEYDSPALVVSMLAKLSRKYSEPNVYTKLKSILSLHAVVQKVSDKACFAVAQSIHTLRREIDEKVGHAFYASETIEDVADMAANVAELEAVELVRAYSTYVFDYLEIKGELATPVVGTVFKSSGKKSSAANARCEALMTLLETGVEVEASSTSGSKGKKPKKMSPVVKQVNEGVKEDRTWTLKELKKIYDASEIDNALRPEVEHVLQRYDSKFKPSINSVKDKSGAEPASTASKTEADIISTPLADEEDEDEPGPEPEVVTTKVQKPSETAKKQSTTKTKSKVGSKAGSGKKPTKTKKSKK